MTYYHTTLSLVGKIPPEKLKSLLDKHSSHYCFIQESGKTGENPHYHVVFKSKLKRTDKVTKFIKDNLYKNTVTNKKTVRTKKCTDSPQYLISYYFFKENKELKDLTYKGFSDEEIIECFNNKTTLLKRQKLSYLDAPYVIYEHIVNTCKEQKLDFEEYMKSQIVLKSVKYDLIRYHLCQLLKEGYAIHHLYKHIEDLSMCVYDLWLINDN